MELVSQRAIARQGTPSNCVAVSLVEKTLTKRNKHQMGMRMTIKLEEKVSLSLWGKDVAIKLVERVILKVMEERVIFKMGEGRVTLRLKEKRVTNKLEKRVTIMLEETLIFVRNSVKAHMVLSFVQVINNNKIYT